MTQESPIILDEAVNLTMDNSQEAPIIGDTIFTGTMRFVSYFPVVMEAEGIPNLDNPRAETIGISMEGTVEQDAGHVWEIHAELAWSSVRDMNNIVYWLLDEDVDDVVHPTPEAPGEDHQTEDQVQYADETTTPEQPPNVEIDVAEATEDLDTNYDFDFRAHRRNVLRRRRRWRERNARNIRK